MPIPDLDAAGVLPPGVHSCSAAECVAAFGRFGGSDRRPRLAERLLAYLSEVGRAGLAAAVVVDGSFVTSKADPNDVDLILLLCPGHDLSADLRPFEYNVLSRRQVRRTFGFDLLVAVEGSPTAAEYLAFFEQIRGLPNRRKGLLRIDLAPDGVP